MPFALNLCYFFSNGNSGWYTPCLKSPSQTKLVYSLFKFPSQTKLVYSLFNPLAPSVAMRVLTVNKNQREKIIQALMG
jgi:hypothetical protein